MCVLSRRRRGARRAAAEVGRAGRADCGYVRAWDRSGLCGDCVHLACRDAVEHNRFCLGKQAWRARRRDV